MFISTMKKKHWLSIISIGVIISLIIIVSFYLFPLIRQNNDLNQDNSGNNPHLTSIPKDFVLLNDNDFYFLNYTENYDWDGYSQYKMNKISNTVKLHPSLASFACSAITIQNQNGRVYFGRNFDWISGTKVLLETNPREGFRSFSMVDIPTIELYSDFEFESCTPEEYIQLVFNPMDGVNEYGLAVAILVSPQMNSSIDPAKSTRSSLEFIRLALDQAQTIDETLQIWNTYNLQYEPGPECHFMIADASGRSAIVEWIDGNMTPIYNLTTWQVLTNFRMYNATEFEKSLCWRYELAQDTISQANGTLSHIELMQLLESIAQASTKWSNVYDLSQGSISIILDQAYHEPAYELTF